MAKLKVYRGSAKYIGNTSLCAFIAATSWKEVSEAVDMPISHLRKYWAVTGYKKHIEVATANPGIVFCEFPDYSNAFMTLAEAEPLAREAYAKKMADYDRSKR